MLGREKIHHVYGNLPEPCAGNVKHAKAGQNLGLPS